MRVLLINTSERIGGAAIAASRLMEALKNNGIKAKLLVRDKQTDQISVVQLERSWLNIWNFVWERVVIWMAKRFSKENIFAIDIANTGKDITSLPEFKQADIIHLHWINQGMLSLRNIKKILHSGKPVVWTMHDMWPLTGICHHPRGCTQFKTVCGCCPFVRKNSSEKDLSYRVFNRKKKLYANVPNELHFVAVSQWQRNTLQQSALLGNNSISVIPNGLQVRSFKKYNSTDCRTKLNIPQDKYVIAFGAYRMDDPIKGFSILCDALRYLDENKLIPSDKIHLVLFGKLKNEDAFWSNIPISYTWLGVVNDTNELSKIYSAANIFAMPSLYETFGQTLIEAMICGCVPIAFDNSGPSDIIDHLHNGYTAHYLSVEDLARGIHWILCEGDLPTLSQQAISKVTTHYTERIIAQKYIELYNKVLNTHD